MAIDLSKPADQVSIDDAAYKPLFKSLQGNILKPHGRNCAWQVFIEFTGSKDKVRAWIRDHVAPNLFTAALQYEQGKKPKGTDGGLVTLFFLSASGYSYLGLDPKKLASTPFRKGMKDQSDGLSELFDTNNKDPKPATWEAGFQKEIHAMVALANDEDVTPRLKAALTALEGQLGGIAKIHCVQEGKVLRRPIHDTPAPDDFEPIEHFGYFDGISQPLFTKEDLVKYYASEKGSTKGKGWDPGASLDLVLVDDPFVADADACGSYLVYRKLAQDYALFNGRVAACAAALGVDEALAGAMVVGRFKDGTPVVDSKVAGEDYNNDFMFDEDDDEGFRCPRHAHIRKVNPRGTTPMTSLEDERKRRIARRGIPYGKPHPDIEPDVPTSETEKGPTERGLLFMCFQASIKKQFQFIQRTWCDNPNFPVSLLNPFKKDTGDDPLIGQDPDETQRWPKKWGDPSAGRKSFNFEAAVTLRGGEYFFAPSKPFLAGL
ncbi:MAG TPA: hypothetical protein VEW71_08595 [Allosphingosinicella sp.]|nr:hypothetical protein [Allosphingosinicella sp.]